MKPPSNERTVPIGRKSSIPKNRKHSGRVSTLAYNKIGQVRFPLKIEICDLQTVLQGEDGETAILSYYL